MPVSLNFTGGSLPSGVTFARSTGATRFDSSGNLETVAVDAPRFDYNPVGLAPLGIIVEPSGSNSMEDGTSLPYTLFQGTRTANAAASPAGTTTATLFRTNSTSLASFYWTGHTSVSGNQVWSFSVYLKAELRSVCQLHWSTASDGDGSNITIDLAAGTITGNTVFGNGSYVSSSILSVGNGWYRVTITGILSWATVTPFPSIVLPAGATNQGIYCYGAQSENRNPASTFIPTGSAGTTRAADQLTFTIPSGTTTLIYTFDDNSTQEVAVSAGAYTVPTNLNRARIKTITEPGAARKAPRHTFWL
jgi:hypothetical protein